MNKTQSFLILAMLGFLVGSVVGKYIYRGSDIDKLTDAIQSPDYIQLTDGTEKVPLIMDNTLTIAEGFNADPPKIQVYTQDSKSLITFSEYGQPIIEFNVSTGDVTLGAPANEAAKVFWDAVKAIAPEMCKNKS